MPRRDSKSRWTRHLKTLGYMLLMGFGVAWALILAYPLAIKLGLSERTAAKLPNAGFPIGMGLGFAMRMAGSVKQFIGGVLGAIALGGVLWFFAVLLEGMLLAFGAPEELVEWFSTAAFCIGVLAGLLPVAVIAKEGFEAQLARFSGSRKA